MFLAFAIMIYLKALPTAVLIVDKSSNLLAEVIASLTVLSPNLKLSFGTTFTFNILKYFRMQRNRINQKYLKI